jgi:hypothetical protein
VRSLRALPVALIAAAVLASCGAAPPHTASTSPRPAPEAAPDTGCVTTARVVPVGLSETRYPNILAHARRAIRAGFPAVMVIHRAGADERRDEALEDHPTRARMDRDEYPMAMGRRTWRADVAYVPADENRSAGAVVGIKLRRFCDGTRFRYVGY